jgi:long-chain acyl-CoA synthetase
VLMKGPNMMKGYWNAPDATAAMIDKQGWLHTGDIGVLDKKGYLTITDRKKDILVLANGKNVAPQPIESKLKQAQLVSEIVLLEADGGVGAIVVPDFPALAAWAKDKGLAASTHAELAALPEARREIKKRIDAASGELAEFERPRKIALIDHAFSIEAGELTPTLKVKRKAVRERYAALLE